MLRNVVLDFNGVIATGAVWCTRQAFVDLGLTDVDTYLDIATQRGLFADLESGAISAETFREQLSRLVGKTVSMEQCCRAWCAFVVDIPARNLLFLRELHDKGIRTALLSNTNPFVAETIMRGQRLDPQGHTLADYVGHLYLSHELHLMKPDRAIYEAMLQQEHFRPEETLFVDDSPANLVPAAALGMQTLLATNCLDWTPAVRSLLHI